MQKKKEWGEPPLLGSQKTASHVLLDYNKITPNRIPELHRRRARREGIPRTMRTTPELASTAPAYRRNSLLLLRGKSGWKAGGGRGRMEGARTRDFYRKWEKENRPGLGSKEGDTETSYSEQHKESREIRWFEPSRPAGSAFNSLGERVKA